MTRQSARESTDSPKAMMLIDHLYNFISVLQTCRLFPAIKWAMCAHSHLSMLPCDWHHLTEFIEVFGSEIWKIISLESVELKILFEAIFKEDSALAHAKFTFTRLWPAPLSYDKKSRVALSFSRHQKIYMIESFLPLRRNESTFIHIPTDSSLRRRHFAIYLNIFLVAFLVFFALVGDCREIFQLIYFSNGSCLLKYAELSGGCAHGIKQKSVSWVCAKKLEETKTNDSSKAHNYTREYMLRPRYALFSMLFARKSFPPSGKKKRAEI